MVKADLVTGLVLRRGLVLSDGSLEPFFTRPISLVLWVGILITVLLSFAPVQRAAARLLGRRRRPAEETP